MRSRLTLSPARFGRGMNQLRSARVVALSLAVVALLAGLTFMLRSSHAQSGGQQPNYGNVDDFLNGGRHLQRNDDLVITYTYNVGSNNRSHLLAGATSNSQVSEYGDSSIVPPWVQGCGTQGGCAFDYNTYTATYPATGRFFNTLGDSTVYYPFQINLQTPLLVSLAGKTVSNTWASYSWISENDVTFVTGADTFLSAVGDFNGDGFDDLLMAYSTQSKFPSNPRMRIATAVDPSDQTKGFRFGPEFSLSNGFGIRAVTAGDFNGDGIPDIASLYVDQSGTLYAATYAVDPASLSISDGGKVSLTTGNSITELLLMQMAVGHFSNATHQQLVVASQANNTGAGTQVQVLDFAPPSLVPVSKINYNYGASLDSLRIKTGRLNWDSPYDQLVLLHRDTAVIGGLRYYGTRLTVYEVDPATVSQLNAKSSLVLPGPNDSVAIVGYDIALGNFDRQEPSQTNPSEQERNPDLQIAVVGALWNVNASSKGAGFIWIYNISEDLSSLTQASALTLTEPVFSNQQIADMSVSAADLQGRSFRLGAGYKVTVDRVQPSVVLAMPPMHADYVSPGINMMPTVFNLSIAPDAFKSEYEQAESTDASVTQTDTTSSSFSGEEKISSSFSIGEVGSDGQIETGVELKSSFTAKQDLKSSTDKINGAFNSSDFEVSQQTGLSDVVWFKDTSYYLYVYPVIGWNVCPADKPNCQESEKIPLQLTFSAPKATTVQRLASDTLEWYQPPWEFGNLFSYPAGLAQLKQYLPDIQLLTADTTVFATDDAAATLKTTWTNGKTTGQNIDNEALFSEDADLSVEGKAGGEGFGLAVKASAGLELNFGGSTGTKSLNESDTKFSSARGITITKSASFTDPFHYKYLFSPYIFGKIKPVGYTDPVNSTADLLSYGALRSAFTVDPLNNASGAWWSQSDYKNFPDVALNHPNRWAYASQGKPSVGPIPSNCVGIDNLSMNCITPTEREPENPWGDPFHDMRGLFITNALNPPSSNALMAPGAQLETATAGDQLTLWARVYNYSFKEMPAGTKVKVRFYAMPLDNQNLPVNEGGGSFLIGETVLAPIAPFDDGPSAPINWVLASTNFDTTGHGNQALAFWVAVWMEDGNGNLMQELPAHGLTGKPSDKEPLFGEIAALEEMVDNQLRQPDTDDPAQVSFSNNIGFYRSAFHILPKSTTTATETATVKVEKVEVSGTALNPGRSVEASATLRNGAQELFGVMVYFYDGEPASGGRLVDIERVARLRAGGQQKVSIRFRPQACGAHRLFVRVAPGRAYAAEGQAARSVQVDCTTPVCFTQACMKSPEYYAKNLLELPQGKVTIAGRGFVSEVKTDNTVAMAKALKGGNPALEYFNQQYVGLQLSLLGTSDPNNDAEKSNLLCYKVNFQPVRLSTRVVLSPEMTIEELLKQARRAAIRGHTIDLRTIAHVMRLLNGEDPEGRCRQ